MEEYELAVGDEMEIPGFATLTLLAVEGYAALLGLDLEDEAEEERLAAEEEG
jgi:hypothetical protein